jgi:hypothetical protein
MKAKFLLLSLLLTVFSACDEQPDLTFQDEYTIWNPCVGIYETLEVKNLYWVQNLNLFNGYPQWVLLYWRNNQGTFVDCYGTPVYVFPGNVIYSYRYVTNKSFGTKSTATARQPAARAYTTVKDVNTGSTITEDDGPKVTLPDIAAGETVEFVVESNVTEQGAYELSYVADPDDEIEEVDEDNNTQRNDFERSVGARGCSFIIRAPTTEELAKIKTRYVLYRNGRIEVYN